MRLFHSVFRSLCLLLLAGQLGDATGQEFHAFALESLQSEQALVAGKPLVAGQTLVPGQALGGDVVLQADFLDDLKDLESELSTVAYAGELPSIQERSSQVLQMDVYEEPAFQGMFSPSRWDISASLLAASRVNDRVLSQSAPIEFGDDFDPGFWINVGVQNVFGYDRIGLEVMNISGNERRVASRASLDYDASVRSILVTVTPASTGTGTADIFVGARYIRLEDSMVGNESVGTPSSFEDEATNSLYGVQLGMQRDNRFLMYNV